MPPKCFQINTNTVHRTQIYYISSCPCFYTSTERWTSVLLGKKWAYTGGASYAIYKLIPKVKLEFGLSPVMLMKGRKNEVEIQGMMDANIRDAVALIDLASILDREIGSVEWDELRDETRRMLS